MSTKQRQGGMVRQKARTNIDVPKKVDNQMEIDLLLMDLEFQKKAIDWNMNYVGKKRKNGSDLMVEMEKIQLAGNSIIVHMFKEYPITAAKVSFNENTKIVSWVCEPSIIDNRKHSTDKESWALNPIPTIWKGVVVGISDTVKLNIANRKKEMEDKGLDVSNYISLSVGDTVYLNHFMTKNMRFYIDKQEAIQDIVYSPTNYTLDNFELLFKVTEFEIESIVKRDSVQDVVDYNYPYADYMMNMNESNFTEYYIINENR